MDRDELIFQEYKLYAEQKENFIDRNFQTNKFYMISFVAIIFAMIFTNNVVFTIRCFFMRSLVDERWFIQYSNQN